MAKMGRSGCATPDSCNQSPVTAVAVTAGAMAVCVRKFGDAVTVAATVIGGEMPQAARPRMPLEGLLEFHEVEKRDQSGGP